MTDHLSLADAVERHVRPGDHLHVMVGHTRWTAAAREVVRQWWDRDPRFTLAMVSLGSLGALFFEGGLVERVVTAYSGDSFPTYTPNPVFQRAYTTGAVAVEHWSILTFAQRLEAAARGLPAVVTGSLVGSSMADNDGFATVASPFTDGPDDHIGLVAPLVPDVCLLHGAVADRAGNVVVAEPMLEGVWGAWAARRGVVATVDAVVEDLGGHPMASEPAPAAPGRSDGIGHAGLLAPRVRIPAHRVLAVVEAPLGAHPGGLFAPGLPVHSYGEDIPFWSEARRAARTGLRAWAKEWVLRPDTHDGYLAQLGAERVRALLARADPRSWQADAAAHPVDEASAPSPWEVAAVHAVDEVQRLIDEHRADAVLAGAGVANLAAWVAVAEARGRGRPVVLTAELGLWGYEPTPADPYIFNHRAFPSASMLTDAHTVLGMVIGGAGTTVIGCLGAAQVDRDGNLNSTLVPGGPFFVGSGGANDVASRAAACAVVCVARPDRLVERLGYVTSPGRRVASVVTDLGVLRRLDGRLRVAAVAAGDAPLADRVAALRSACGFPVDVVPSVEELPPPSPARVLALRRFDVERLFLT